MVKFLNKLCTAIGILFLIGFFYVMLIRSGFVSGFMDIDKKYNEKQSLAYLGYLYKISHAHKIAHENFPESCEQLDLSTIRINPDSEIFYKHVKNGFVITARAKDTKTIFKIDQDKIVKKVDSHVQGINITQCP